MKSLSAMLAGIRCRNPLSPFRIKAKKSNKKQPKTRSRITDMRSPGTPAKIYDHRARTNPWFTGPEIDHIPKITIEKWEEDLDLDCKSPNRS